MFKTKKIDQTVMDLFLDNFDWERKTIAQEISQMLKRKDLEDFYFRLLSRFSATESSVTLTHLVDFLFFIILSKKRIPGYSGIILSDAILELGDFPKEIVRKFPTIKDFDLKASILDFSYTIEGFYSEENKESLENHIIEKDFFLINTLLRKKLNASDLKNTILRVMGSKNRYLIWGAIQIFSELASPYLNDYVDEILDLNDPLLTDQIQRYTRILSVISDTKYEYTPADLVIIGPDNFDYIEFTTKICDPYTGVIFEQDKIDELIIQKINDQNT